MQRPNCMRRITISLLPRLIGAGDSRTTAIVRVMGRYTDVHARPKGPGDARPSALQIVNDESMGGQLKGKVVLITGAASGIGVEVARALHATGAHLFLAVRDTSKGQKVADEIQRSGTSGAQISVLKLDMDSLKSVRECATAFLDERKQLNILINNAGVMACPEGRTKDGFETQFGVNHLAHFLLFQLLRKTLLTSASPTLSSRVVSVASLEVLSVLLAGHRSSPILFDDLDLRKQGYDKWIAYGQSKTANIYLANEVERRYGSQGLHATSLHPGGIQTNLTRHLDADFLKGFDNPGVNATMKSPEQGAATTVWAAISKDWESKGGVYLEDCDVSPPLQAGDVSPLAKGYNPWAYDEAAAKQLWDISNNLVGLPYNY